MLLVVDVLRVVYVWWFLGFFGLLLVSEYCYGYWLWVVYHGFIFVYLVYKLSVDEVKFSSFWIFAEEELLCVDFFVFENWRLVMIFYFVVEVEGVLWFLSFLYVDFKVWIGESFWILNVIFFGWEIEFFFFFFLNFLIFFYGEKEKFFWVGVMVFITLWSFLLNFIHLLMDWFFNLVVVFELKFVWRIMKIFQFFCFFFDDFFYFLGFLDLLMEFN